jgi:hypothetical protein
MSRYRRYNRTWKRNPLIRFVAVLLLASVFALVAALHHYPDAAALIMPTMTIGAVQVMTIAIAMCHVATARKKARR